MKKLILANQLDGENENQSDQSTVYESIRTTRINAKRSLNYIFFKDDNVSSEIDAADRMIELGYPHFFMSKQRCFKFLGT